MKILLSGANGYIGRNLLPELLKAGHEVICCVRNKSKLKLNIHEFANITIYEVDFLDKDSLNKLPKDIEIAYYLIHSMSGNSNFENNEIRCAINFREYLSETNISQVIYLGSILNAKSLSKHMNSRKKVEEELIKGSYYFTALRAGIVIGKGSASFEIIKNLVEKLPIIFAPSYLSTKCQPIGLDDTINILVKSIKNDELYNKDFDIGAQEIVTYRDLLLIYAKCKNLKRPVVNIPVKTPFLSAFWLFLATSTSYRLARALIESVSIEFICRDDKILKILNIAPKNIEESISKA
ncbi:MAG: hypothetical protein C0598_10885 [Marinilabiliales bacterium]|nr:MAG: hypothetical protein C0598_10885 [Marinilabiliales bacterium]